MLFVSLLPTAQAQVYPATWVGGSGAWIALKPGDWTIVDWNSPWKFFPDNSGNKYFMPFIPSGHVYLDTSSVPGENGVPIPYLGVTVSTLALDSNAELTIRPGSSLKIEGVGGVGGLLTNQGLITLEGNSVLQVPFVMPIVGSGEIAFRGSGSFLTGLGLVTQPGSHTMSGFGNIALTSFINEGTVIADTPGESLYFVGGQLTNKGTLRAGGRTPGAVGGELRLKPLVGLTNEGTIVAENGLVKIESATLDNSGVIEARSLGTVSFQDVVLGNGAGSLVARDGGAIFFNGSMRITGGSLLAEGSGKFAVGSGVTDMRGSVSLTGLLRTEGGTLLFNGSSLGMSQGTIELAAGTIATTSGTSVAFTGGTWRGAGMLRVTTPSFWNAAGGMHVDGTTLELHVGTHHLAGTITNDGTIATRNTSFNTPLRLVLDGTTRLNGTGLLTFAQGAQGHVVQPGVAGARLENGPLHTVRAATGTFVTLSADLLNEGTFEAVGNGTTVALTFASAINRGLIQASGGARIDVGAGGYDTTIDNVGGRIVAAAGSLIQLAQGHPLDSGITTIRGGALGGAGVFQALRQTVLDGATSGPLTIESGATVKTSNGINLYLTGEIRNHGTIEVADPAYWVAGSAFLRVSGSAVLNGTGAVRFSIGDEGVIAASGADALLTIGADQRIVTNANVLGTINVALANHGRIAAEGGGSTLNLFTTSIVNRGVIEASGGAQLLVGLGASDTMIDNVAGRIVAGAGSTVWLSQGHPSANRVTTVRGGTLAGAGVIAPLRLVLFDGATSGPLTIEAGATVRTNNGSNLYLTGEILNHGTIDVADQAYWVAGNSTLWISGRAFLGGSGSVRFSMGDEGVIAAAGAGALLTIGADQRVVTNAGVLGTISAPLENFGRIAAEGTGSTLNLYTPSIVNHGVIEANGGTRLATGLNAVNSLIDNAGGRIVAAKGGEVLLGHGHPTVTGVATVQGGTLAGQGVILPQRLVVFDGATHGPMTIEAGATVRLQNGSTLYLSGQIVNDGTLEVLDPNGYPAGTASMRIDGAATLSGAGTTRIAGGGEGLVTGVGRLTVAAGHTLRTQASDFGTVNVALINAGRIEASGAQSTLALRSLDIRNTGVLGAYAGGALNIGEIQGHTVIDNRGGRIEAGAGSIVRLADLSHPLLTGFTTVSGGMLTGSGTIQTGHSALAGGVVVSPGSSPGILTFSGALALDPLGALRIEIGGTVAGSSHDRVVITGAASLAGILDVILLPGFVPGAGDAFTILTASGVSGAFLNVIGGRVAFASGDFGIQVTANSVVLRDFVAAPVPEPGTWILLLAGLASVLIAARAVRRAGRTEGTSGLQ